MLACASPEDPERKPRHPGRGLLVAGVAAAAVMGVGLGLWARPEMSERRMALAVMKPVKPAVTRTLEIVLDDGPAPLGAPIVLLPATGEAPRAAPAERPAPDLLAPVRSATGLVRVQAVEPEPVGEPPPRVIAKPDPKPAPRKVTTPKLEKAVTSKGPKGKPPRLEKVKAVAKPKGPPAKIARIEPKPAKPAVRTAKVERPAKARIEKARIAPHKVTAAPAKAQKVKLETKKPKAVAPVVRVTQAAKSAAPARPLKPAKGAGPVRLAKAQPAPNTAIRDADRQMSRAYSTARAAGVPDWQLRKQQARWEAARASAAREAPWAVRDVYLARIAELHDLTKDAQASGY
jgi:hypothetical protein